MCVAFYLYHCGHYSNTGPCIAQHSDVIRCPQANYTIPVDYKCRDCSLSDYMDHYYPERIPMRHAQTHLRHSREALLHSLEAGPPHDISSPRLRRRTKNLRAEAGPPIAYHNRQSAGRPPTFEPQVRQPSPYQHGAYVGSPPPPPSYYDKRSRRRERRASPLRDAFARDGQRRPLHPLDDTVAGAQASPPLQSRKTRIAAPEPSFAKRWFSRDAPIETPRKPRRSSFGSGTGRDRPLSYRDSTFDPLRSNPATMDIPLSMLRVPSCSKSSRRFGVVFR